MNGIRVTKRPSCFAAKMAASGFPITVPRSTYKAMNALRQVMGSQRDLDQLLKKSFL
jgi:hypothetical protein